MRNIKIYTFKIEDEAIVFPIYEENEKIDKNYAAKIALEMCNSPKSYNDLNNRTYEKTFQGEIVDLKQFPEPLSLMENLEGKHF